ncbi:MAG: hypothetical protein ACRELB_02540 [Polyangiaceae bacterium]
MADEPTTSSDAVLEALWKRVLDAWDDDRTHAALLEHAVREQQLPEIAGRYRALGDDPARGPLAKKKLDAIVLAATQMLMSMKTPKAGKVPLPITLSAFGVSAILLGWLAWALWGKH